MAVSPAMQEGQKAACGVSDRSIYSQIPSQHETRLPVGLPLTDVLENVSLFWSLSFLLTEGMSDAHLE